MIKLTYIQWIAKKRKEMVMKVFVRYVQIQIESLPGVSHKPKKDETWTLSI